MQANCFESFCTWADAVMKIPMSKRDDYISPNLRASFFHCPRDQLLDVIDHGSDSYVAITLAELCQQHPFGLACSLMTAAASCSAEK